MFSPSRRSFFGASLAGLASTPLFAADKPAPVVPDREEFAFQPNTLMLTWQRDPTTTMTVQWVGTRGETADTRIYFAPAPFAFWQGAWRVEPTTAKHFGETDLKVFRAEMTGLLAVIFF